MKHARVESTELLSLMATVKTNQASIQPKSAGWPALLTASTFNPKVYASSPGNRAYCYTELAVSSLIHVVEAVNIASIHFAYPWSDGQAELARMAWSNTKMLYLRTHLTHLSTNPAQR